MLDPAYLHAGELKEKLARASREPRCRYYFAGGWMNYEPKVDDSDWSEFAMVSVSTKGEVLGYMRAQINRWQNTASALCAISFREGSLVFARDLRRFLLELVCERGIRSLTWSAIEGSPAEEMYERLAKRYGGRKVGVFEGVARLADGRYYNEVFYQLYCEWAKIRLLEEREKQLRDAFERRNARRG